MNEVGFIFDLDGTLIDSALQIYNALNLTASNFGMDNFDMISFQRSFGLPLESTLLELGLGKTDIPKFVSVFRKKLYQSIIINNIVFEGVEDLLSYLQILGIRTGIATSKPTELAKLVYSNSSLSKHSMVVLGTDGFPPKPDPTVVKKAVKSLEITKGYMVGDRIEDCLAGQAAGLMTIGVTQSAHTVTDFEKVGADYVFANIKELEQNLNLLVEVG